LALDRQAGRKGRPPGRAGIRMRSGAGRRGAAAAAKAPKVYIRGPYKKACTATSPGCKGSLLLCCTAVFQSKKLPLAALHAMDAWTQSKQVTEICCSSVDNSPATLEHHMHTGA